MSDKAIAWGIVLLMMLVAAMIVADGIEPALRTGLGSLADATKLIP